MNTILATTDFSLENRSMLQYAAQLAMDLRYRLRLIHATHVSLASDEFFSEEVTLSALSDSDRGQMLQEVVRLRNRFGPSLIVDADVKIGFVQEILRDQLSKGSVSLVVMTVSKSNRLERFLFGSSVANTIGKLPCPLLLIPKNYTYRKWKSVAIAYDRVQLQKGCNLSLIHDALVNAEGKVHVVHVQKNQEDVVTRDEENNVSAWLGQPISKVHEVEDKERNISETLLDWTHRYRPNTMLMIARKHGLLHQLMEDSISREVAFHTNTPLMICTDTTTHENHRITNIEVDQLTL